MDINIGNNQPFFLIAGPCQIESQAHALKMATEIKKIADRCGIDFYYKSSFDKANRTSLHGKRGAGLEEGMKIFDYLKQQIPGLKIITDVHTEEQCAQVAPHVDALQIPAFLCRQTDLLLAAGKTGLPINVKKGQFLAPWDMSNVADKIASTGNKNIWLCDRGTSFGYNTLVSDMRGLYEMKKTGYPVIIDATCLCLSCPSTINLLDASFAPLLKATHTPSFSGLYEILQLLSFFKNSIVPSEPSFI